MLWPRFFHWVKVWKFSDVLNVFPIFFVIFWQFYNLLKLEHISPKTWIFTNKTSKLHKIVRNHSSLQWWASICLCVCRTDTGVSAFQSPGVVEYFKHQHYVHYAFRSFFKQPEWSRNHLSQWGTYVRGPRVPKNVKNRFFQKYSNFITNVVGV